MTKHNKYYWDLDRNKPYKDYLGSNNKINSGSEFKSTYIGDKNDEELNNKIEKKQHEISIIITAFRILGYAFIPFSLVLASCVLILSELISWILIFDNKK